MRKEARPEGSPTRQNVRVGESLGIRYTGIGVKFNFEEEFSKSKKLGFSTFSAAYFRSSDSEVIGRLTPDGNYIAYQYINRIEDPFMIVTIGKAEKLFPEGLLEITEENDGEIIVVPSGVFQTPEILDILPGSDIQSVFESRASLQDQLQASV